MIDIHAFFDAVIRQDRAALRAYFCADAVIRWPCTGERFGVEDYLRANCEYPGDWAGEIERVERCGELTILVARIWPKDETASFHAVSFLRCENGKITEMDEYWADDGPPPAWRQALGLGQATNRTAPLSF